VESALARSTRAGAGFLRDDAALYSILLPRELLRDPWAARNRVRSTDFDEAARAKSFSSNGNP